MGLSSEELRRYNRHLVLDGFGVQGQEKLRASKILVVGAGGLGCPALLYLAAAGIGKLGIVDGDQVELSNLQRQVLYNESDLGKPKAIAAAERLREKNSTIEINAFNIRMSSSNAMEIIEGYDIVIDATDNLQTRYLINDACVLSDKPFIYGSILRFEGQVGVFNLRTTDGFSANYRDVFPVPPDASAMPNCEQAGVIGVIPGIIGSFQANEAIKIAAGLEGVLTDKLLIFDCLTMEQTIIKIKNLNSRKQINRLIDYDAFCNAVSAKTKNTPMKEITVQELKELIDSGADFQLIDVREPHEYDICNIGGELIPQGDIPDNVDKISKDKKVVVHCRSGARSGNMVQWLEANENMTNLYNLKGGILAWAREIDPDMPTY